MTVLDRTIPITDPYLIALFAMLFCTIAQDSDPYAPLVEDINWDLMLEVYRDELSSIATTAARDLDSMTQEDGYNVEELYHVLATWGPTMGAWLGNQKGNALAEALMPGLEMFARCFRLQDMVNITPQPVTYRIARQVL